MLKETLVADLKSVGNNPKVDQRLARICEGLEKTEKIADAFTYEHVLLRYAEECAEASAALLRYRRALVIGDGSVPLAREMLASELADMRVMHDQVIHKEPQIQDMEMSEYMRKINRTIKRYRIGEDE